MKIGIIGAGWLGGTVGEAWVAAGHDVMFSARDLAKQEQRAKRLGPHAFAGTVQEAASFGDVALIAVPYSTLPKLAETLCVALKGKLLIDACNPYIPDPEAFRRDIEAEGVAQATARMFPSSRVVRAFSAVDATDIEASAAGRGAKLGVPVASDDPAALADVEALVRDAGCEPVKVGDLAAARKFQRGGPGFRANTNATDLRDRLGLN